MRTPASALVWEQWRRTWYTLPFAAAITGILVWWLPWLLASKYSTEARINAKLAPVSHAAVLLSAFFLIMLYSEGGRRGLLGDRHFTLPVSSRLIGVLPVLTCCAWTLGIGVLVTLLGVSLYGWASLGIVDVMCHVALAAVMYAGTLRARNVSNLRAVLALLLAIPVGAVLFLPDMPLFDRAVLAVLLIAASTLYSMGVITADRSGGTSLLFRGKHLVTAGQRRLESWRPLGSTPSKPSRVLLWSELRAGNSLALPVLLLLFGVFMALMAAGFSRLFFLFGRSMDIEWAGPVGTLLISLGTFALTVSLVGIFGPSLVGKSDLFQVSPLDHFFVYTRPVPDAALSTMHLKSLTLQTLVWAVCIGAGSLLITGAGHMADKGAMAPWAVLVEWWREHGFLAVAGQALGLVAVFAAGAWVVSGMFVSCALAARPWINRLLTFMGLFWLVLVWTVGVLASEYKGVELLQKLLAGGAGSLFLLVSILPPAAAFWKRAADRRWLVFFTLFWSGVVLVIIVAGRSLFPTDYRILWAGLHALPLAPVGLIPLALAMGRHR